jgi:cytoskeletal protein RodZ
MAYRGKSLKALRESKRIRLRRISNETRINMAYLEDLEGERFDRFPGKFYFESFTKEYARSLGLDPNEVLTDLQGAYAEWHGASSNDASSDTASVVEDGLLNRIAGYIRNVQEV